MVPIAVILIIGWAIGTFALRRGRVIHILLVIAVIPLILGFLSRDTTAIYKPGYRFIIEYLFTEIWALAGSLTKPIARILVYTATKNIN